MHHASMHTHYARHERTARNERLFFMKKDEIKRHVEIGDSGSTVTYFQLFFLSSRLTLQ